MKKVIFTLLLLIAPLCKAADDRYLHAVNQEAWQAVTQCIGYYVELHRPRFGESHEMFLNGYELKKIPTLNLPNLERLYLDNNLIKTINNLDNFQNLQVLSLRNNLIAAGLDNLNHAEQLQVLYLNNNKIKTIPNLNCANLQQLYLSNNKIKIITDEHINPLAYLRWLFLEDNQIETLADLNLEYLTQLNLDNNQIETTANFTARHLVHLSLSNNHISAVPENLPNLRILYLNNNNIRTTTGNNGLPNLRILSLENNGIETIDPQELAQFPYLEQLHLDQNYLLEDNITQLKEYATGHPNLYIDFGTQREGGCIKSARKS